MYDESLVDQIKNTERTMGNQNVKPGKRSSQGTVYPFAEPEKKSRTDWTAGNSQVWSVFRNGRSYSTKENDLVKV